MRTKDNLELLKIAFAIVVVAAIIAVFPINSFSFYMFVRWVVFLGCVLTIPFFIIAKDYAGWVLLSLLVAFDFNPFSINISTKSWWVAADIVVAVFFGYLFSLCTKVSKEIDTEEKNIASKPNQSLAEISQNKLELKQKIVKRIDGEDREILERRKRNGVSKENLRSMAKDVNWNTKSGYFTSQEIIDNRRYNNRQTIKSFFILAIIVGVIILVVHLVHRK